MVAVVTIAQFILLVLIFGQVAAALLGMEVMEVMEVMRTDVLVGVVILAIIMLKMVVMAEAEAAVMVLVRLKVMVVLRLQELAEAEAALHHTAKALVDQVEQVIKVVVMPTDQQDREVLMSLV